MAGPEAANNAAFSGVLVPLLALNLPLIRIWVKVPQIPRPVLYAG